MQAAKLRGKTGGGRNESLRLLLVEDTFDMAEAIMIRLDRSGIACDLAKSLEEARACVNVQHYDVIVLDINLPDGLGTELLKEIRSRGERTPVLMLTARSSRSDEEIAYYSGVDEYVGKPFDREQLVLRVNAMLEHGTRIAPLPTSSDGTTQSDETPGRRVARL
mgnify:CR=1 FL=1